MQRITFGGCSLSEDGTLTTPNGQHQLSRRLAIVLRALIEARGTAVHADHLLDSFWGPGSGAPQYLAKAIFQIRQAVDGAHGVSIETIYGYGYRLRIAEMGQSKINDRDRAGAICAEAAHRVYDRRDIALNAALAMYEEASRLDPNCVGAYTGYAETQMQLMATGQTSPRTGWAAALHALTDALQHDPQAADAHGLLALGQCLFDWDVASAWASLDTALRLAPANYIPNECAGRIRLFTGKPEDAVACFRRALQANPMAMNTNGVLAYALGCSGDTRGAIEHINAALQLDPGNPMCRTYYAWVEAAHGNAEKASEVGAEVHAQLPNSATIAAVYAYALARAGRSAAARALLSSLEHEDKYPTRCRAITSHVWRELGDVPAAIHALRSGAADRGYWLGIMLNDPGHAGLRADPGFREVYESVFGKPG